MKRTFIRGVWGIYDNSHRLLARRSKIDKDIDRVLSCKFNESFVTYVFGEDNFQRMTSKGFNCVLIHKEPSMFDLIKYQYRHKMEVIRYAMEEDKYDEIVWLDWDCIPQKKLPEDFWKKCGQKGPIQGCLQMYYRKKCNWRIVNKRKVINGGFLYIRDKTMPFRAIKLWETMPQDNDEPAWSLLIDKIDEEFLNNNWENTDLSMKRFWDIYETSYCVLGHGSPFPKELLDIKDACFIHFI